MPDRPILFSAPMIRAILREIAAPGTGKTQTRRLLKLPAKGIYEHPNMGGWAVSTVGGKGCYLDPAKTIPAPERVCIWHQTTGTTILPPYAPGDHLWVREAHALVPRTAYRMSIGTGTIAQQEHPTDGYSAALFREGFDRSGRPRWRPGIHMPRWASRLTLHVTDVRVQRLQDISEDDAVAEGCRGFVSRDGEDGTSPREEFHDLWDSLNAERAPWASNPWVVAVTFRPVPGNIDEGRA